MMNKLKRRWNISSNFQLIVIFTVFAVTGSLSIKVAKPLLHVLGVDGLKSAWPWLYWIIRILIIFPVYQILLVCIGFLMGQFRFFWNFEKKLLRRMGIRFAENES